VDERVSRVWGGGGAHLESLRFHFNLILASLKTLANHMENEATGANGTGGSAAPREPAKPKNPSKNKGRPLYTPQNPCITTSSHRTTFYLISQNKVEHQPKGHGTGPGGLMTIKSPETGSRTQEPLRFPGLSKPPNLRFLGQAFAY
jgi:hypothetical protein